MADSKAQRLALTLLHMVVAALLIVAMRRQGHNYYVFLRFAVCGASIYIAYWWRRHGWFFSVVFGAVAILFNPFVQFVFSKATWSVIDFVSAIVFVLFSLVYFQLSGPLLGGSILCLFGVILVVHSVQDVLSAIRLASSGVNTMGTLLDVQEQIEDCDSCAGHIRRTYDVTYTFRTASGHSIEGFINVGYDPAESGEENVAIVYNPSNPSESRLAEARQSTIGGTVVIGFILTSVAVILCLFGVGVIRDAVKKSLLKA